TVPLEGNLNYYQNYGEWPVREIQDRDIFYHNLGPSIENARKADIILVGHSMVMWAFREDLIKEFEQKHGVKIYNLSFAGIASGEFVKKIAKRWGLKPKLWVINADDQMTSFFNPVLDDFGPFGKSTALEVVKYGRFNSYLKVTGRNLRWRLENKLNHFLPESLKQALGLGPSQVVWRSIENGNWYLEKLAVYTNPANPLIHLKRTSPCPLSSKELEQAKSYLSDLGGNSLFMLVPSENFCSQRVKELASALRREAVMPPNVAYTTADGGQHLDKKGAIAFTRFFLSSLERTQAFKKAVAS
ncbi:MAG TPA: hypothetical protein VLH77_05750, partial [Gammaproteobacteria bacterium]|nr:hypothetical protein [Gammaproteobacteria bacterium]